MFAAILVALAAAAPAFGVDSDVPGRGEFAAFDVSDDGSVEALLVLDVSELSADEADEFATDVESATGATFVDFLTEDGFREAQADLKLGVAEVEVATASKSIGTPNIKPNLDRNFVRPEATLNIRNNNRAGTVNWGILLSASTRSIIVGSVTESGALGYNGSLFLGKNSPHTRGAAYHFHGTFRVAQRPITFRFSDTFSFRAQVGKTSSQGYLLVTAKVRLLG